MQYFQVGARGNCLICLTQYPPTGFGTSSRPKTANYFSAETHKEKFLRNANCGDETWVIYLVLPQDKLKLSAMMNVDYCKLLAHNIFNLTIVERRLYF